tara:strand:- start:1349 stop:4429 length:3081 start_codon:yes stop_codon:yes gene_type:complete
MAQFKPASRPGSYQPLVAPVDRTSSLARKQQKERDAQVLHNKQLADTHRAFRQSVVQGHGVESTARENALKFDRYFRDVNTKFELQAIEAAQQSALRNAEQKQQQVNTETDQLVSLVQNTLQTGHNIYKQREAAIVKSQQAAIDNTILTMGTSIQQAGEIRGIEAAALADENTNDATIRKYLDLGYTRDQLRSIIGARQSVYDLSLLNQTRRAVANSQYYMFDDAVHIKGFPENTTAESLRRDGNMAGVAQAHRQYIQSLGRQYQAATGKTLPWAAVQKQFDQSLSAVLASTNRIRKAQADARYKHEEYNHLSNVVLSEGIQGWKNRIDKNPELIYQDLENFKYLATVTGSGVDREFITKAKELINPHSKEKYGVQYRSQFDAITDALDKEDRSYLQRAGTEEKLLTQSFVSRISQSIQEGQTITPAGGEAILQEYYDSGGTGSGAAAIEKALNAAMPDEEATNEAANAEWLNIRENNQFMVGWTEGDVRQLARTNGASSKWVETKINEMYKFQGRDPFLKDAETHIEDALSRRLGIHTKDKRAHSTLGAAKRYALEKYKADRARLGIDGHDEALALFDKAFGSDKDAFDENGRYSIANTAKDPNTKGFIKFQSDAAGVEGLAVDYEELRSRIDQASNNSTIVGVRLDAIKTGKVDTSDIITSDKLKTMIENWGDLSIEPDVETYQAVEILKDAVGGGKRMGTMDLLMAVANARGIEIKEQKAQTPVADQIIEDLRERYGGRATREILYDTGASSNLLKEVSIGEGGYDSTNNGTAGIPSIHKTPSKMTLGQIQSAMDNGTLFAVGRFQTTSNGGWPGFKSWLNGQGYGDDTEFAPEIQDLYWNYTLEVKRPIVGQYVNGNPNISTEQANLELAAEFASIGVPYAMKAGSYGGGWPRRDIQAGESLYVGVGGNAARGNSHLRIQRSLQLAQIKQSKGAPTVVPTTVAPNTGTGRDGTFGAGTTGQGRKGDGPPKPKPTHITKKEEDEIILLEELGNIEGEPWVSVQIGNKITNMTKREYLAQGGKL